MIRARKIGPHATVLLPDNDWSRVSITEQRGGLVEFDVDQLDELRQELASARRELKRANAERTGALLDDTDVEVMP